MRAKVEITVTIHVSFPLSDNWKEVSDHIWQAAKGLDGECVESGAGFSERDLIFSFPNESKAREFETFCRSLQIEADPATQTLRLN